jgi:hypothetical protein
VPRQEEVDLPLADEDLDGSQTEAPMGAGFAHPLFSAIESEHAPSLALAYGWSAVLHLCTHDLKALGDVTSKLVGPISINSSVETINPVTRFMDSDLAEAHSQSAFSSV